MATNIATNKNSNVIKFRKSKRRKKIFYKRIFLLSIPIIFILSVLIIKNIYISNQCKNLSYSINYYLTSKVSKEYRLKSVTSMTILDKTESSITIDANGLSVKPPYGNMDISSTFIKEPNGKWVIEDINIKK